MDATGTLHLLYYVGNTSHGDLFYVKSSDAGMTWSTPIRVNSEAGSAIAAGTIRGGQIALGKNGRVHVAWNGSSKAEPPGQANETGRSPMLYSRLNDAQTGFEPERNLITHTFNLDGGGAVAADSLGDVYVAWHGNARGGPEGEAGRQVWVAISRDDGKTFAAEHAASKEPTGACGCCGLAILADSRANVWSLYRSAMENVHRDIHLLKSSDQGRTFENRKLDAWTIDACPMSSMGFAEGSRKIEGAWETAGQVYFESLASNATPVEAPGEGKSRKHPRLAISRGGNTLMVWTEAMGWNRGGSLAWQLYDPDGQFIGRRHNVAGVPAESFGAVVAKPDGNFLVIY